MKLRKRWCPFEWNMIIYCGKVPPHTETQRPLFQFQCSLIIKLCHFSFRTSSSRLFFWIGFKRPPIHIRLIDHKRARITPPHSKNRFPGASVWYCHGLQGFYHSIGDSFPAIHNNIILNISLINILIEVFSNWGQFAKIKCYSEALYRQQLAIDRVANVYAGLQQLCSSCSSLSTLVCCSMVIITTQLKGNV